ncbi:MAG: EAL domain-containing protein [Rhizobiaceae bacterium]|nr:EAL domain-containing protein [Rhizobiaceae bacterium]
MTGPDNGPAQVLAKSRPISLENATPQSEILETQIVEDQLAEARSGLWISMPISAALSLLILSMEHRTGHGWNSLLWFTCVNLVNGARLALASGPIGTRPHRQLDQLKVLALISGFCWSYLAVLTNGFTQPGSTFHIIILAGICAGAVTYGGSCASLSVNFIAPPLVISASALVWRGTFESCALAFAVCLFFLGLFRSANTTEERFLELSRLRRKAELFAQDMERSSREDPLTGLLNRRGFEHALTTIRNDGATVAVLAIDLDGFKAINDIYGHWIGDQILVDVARRISRWAPSNAIIARVGGDEFAVVHKIGEGTDIGDSELQNLIGSLTNPFPQAPASRIGACIGVYKTGDLDLRSMLLHADVALYAAKARGTNAFYIFDEKLRGELERRQDIQREIPSAIASKHLTAWFQPVVNMENSTVAGFEALLRWVHPTHGPIPPPEIIAAARETGSLPSITEMVFANCCDLLERLDRTGYPKVWVAMNLSPLELEATDTQKAILEELQRRGLSAKQFEIEITEESSLDYARVNDKLKNLADAGVSIALDDFGTGFSTFSSIKNGWITKIKIDKEFVIGSPTSLDDAQLVKSIIDLGKALGIKVSAEGVETRESAALLLKLGCKLAQGFLYSKPVPISDVPETMKAIEANKSGSAS